LELYDNSQYKSSIQAAFRIATVEQLSGFSAETRHNFFAARPTKRLKDAIFVVYVNSVELAGCKGLRQYNKMLSA